jgi:hypothetical protein
MDGRYGLQEIKICDTIGLVVEISPSLFILGRQVNNFYLLSFLCVIIELKEVVR